MCNVERAKKAARDTPTMLSLPSILNDTVVLSVQQSSQVWSGTLYLCYQQAWFVGNEMVRFSVGVLHLSLYRITHICC